MPRLVLAAGRHRQLDVVDADDLDHGSASASASTLAFGVAASRVGLGRSSSRRLGAFGASRRLGVGRRAREPAVAALHASMSWPAHGSKSDSSGSWAGRSASGTWMRFTRTRYQSDDRPRMPSTRMSAGSRYCDDLRVARLPALEALERLLLVLAPARSRRPGSPSCAGRSASGSRARPTRSGRPAFGSPAATAAARSAATSGGGPPRLAAARLVLGRRPALPSTAGRAAARRPASRSSVATARRPALGLVAGAQLEERLERADRVVDARRPGRRSPRTGPGRCRS